MAVSFMKTGVASAQIAQADQQKKDNDYAARALTRRFFMKAGETGRRVTFVDGVLSPEGFLLPPRFYEHNLFIGGEWGNHYVCPEQSNPEAGEKCPICEGGDKPYLAALFTIIDHQKYEVQKGPNKGKVYVDQKRLYVAKSQTMEILAIKAKKWGGLAGFTVDIDRIGEQSPSVGNGFEKISEDTIENLQKKFMEQFKDEKGVMGMRSYFTPVEYDKEIVYKSSDELLKLGFGKPVVTGTVMNPGGVKTGGANYGGQL